MGKYDEKAKERTVRYMSKRDRLTMNFAAGLKDRYRNHAEINRGKSLTALILDLLEKDILAFEKEKDGD